MKQITLNDENFKTLQVCVSFSLEDVQETAGKIGANAGETEILNLESAIEFCTREVS